MPLRMSCVGTKQPANYLNLIICLRIYIHTNVKIFLLFIESEVYRVDECSPPDTRLNLVCILTHVLF